jgi:hypothetical protein
MSVAFFVVVFTPIQEALEFRNEINKPLDLNEEDPLPFSNIMRSNKELRQEPVAPGWHQHCTTHSSHPSSHSHHSAHSRHSAHSSGAVNRAFDYTPYDVYRPTGPPLTDQSRGISVYPTAPLADIAHGNITTLAVNM